MSEAMRSLEQSIESLGATANRIADERNKFKAQRDKVIEAATILLGAAKLTIGFCVAFREDVPDWQRFPEVGILYAKVTEAMKAAEAKL